MKNNAAKPGSNVVTYDLRDLGGKGHHQQSLGDVFSIIENAKQNMRMQDGAEEGKLEDVMPSAPQIINA